MDRLRPDILTCTTTDGMELLDERTGRYWQLNRTGALVLAALVEGATLQQITNRLIATRPVSPEHATADVTALVKRLRREGLVTSSS